MKTLSIQSLFSWIFVIILTCGAVSVEAATRTVTKSTNSNDGVCDADCSLREAVAVANPGDTVNFAPTLIGQTFVLGGSEIIVTKSIIMDGNLDGVNVAFVSGGGTSRIFNIAPGGGLDLRNMILVQGNGVGTIQANTGGAIYAQPTSALSLNRVAIRGNTASNHSGGLFTNEATVHIVNSSITGNTSTECAALTFVESTVNIANVTIGNNRDVVINDGETRGAVCLLDSPTNIRNATIVNNRGFRSVLVLQNTMNVGPTPLTLGNTIVADNEIQSGGDVDDFFNQDQITSVGGNLIGSVFQVPPGTFNGVRDTIGQNPLVAPVNSQQGGHPIDTHPLQAGSPAINNGITAVAIDPLTNAPLAFDARGSEFPRLAGMRVDKGAFEDQSNGSTLIVSKLSEGNDNVCDLDCSLREAVFAAGADAGTDNITMAANVFGTMNVTSEIRIEDQTVTITGYPSLSSTTLVISGNNTARVFRLSNANVTMTGFTMANGSGQGQSQPFGGGAMLVFGGSLILDRVIIRNSTTAEDGPGGAISVNLASVVRIMNSTISDNSAPVVSAASIDASITYITNTTISGNNNTVGGDGLGAISIGDTLYMRNSTIANNRGSNTTGGTGLSCGGSATCNLGNNIFADNLAPATPDLVVLTGGTLVSVGGNLVETTTGYNNAILTETNDQIGVDPMLLPLANNGGNVPTQVLHPLSPAVNTGVNAVATDPFSSAVLATDARGAGFPRILGGVVDKGSFEAAGTTAASVSVGGRVTAGGRPLGKAKVILTDQHGATRTVLTSSFGFYKFDEVEIGGTYIVKVLSKMYQFDPRIVVVTDQLTDLDFTPNQSGASAID